MDSSPPPPLTAVMQHHHHQPDSSVSSPTCRQWDDSLPPPKLRLMCSYGGHIMPRPHDKSLCYVGGDTRIVVADRHTCLADLSFRISRTLLHGRPFTLKYQLPTEDLDSLVSVTTDEDLDNMIEEHDRLDSSNTSSNPTRLRLFLFLSKPETSASMGCLLDDAKSETWFVDALNGADLLPRILSDSATTAIDNLLELKDEPNIENGEMQNSNVTSEKMGKRQDMQSSLPDSAMVETTSSFGSSSSSPCMSNLPSIKVGSDQMAGLDEQMLHMNVGPPAPLPMTTIGTEYLGRVVGNEDQVRRPPLPLQAVQRKIGNDVYSLPSPDSKHGGAYAPLSPDSIASDSSIASANGPSRHTFYQNPNPSTIFQETRPPTTTSDVNYAIPIQQTPHSGDIQPPPPPQNQDQQQQQFYQTQPHYIHHHPTNQNMPISSYYPVYAPPPSQQQMDHQQQYPFYILPAATNAAMMPPSAATPPLYPAKTTAPSPAMIQVPTNQYQHQYLNVSHHPPAATGGGGGNYGYEYGHPNQEHVYYSQYQSMTPAAAMLLTHASAAGQQQAPENGQ